MLKIKPPFILFILGILMLVSCKEMAQLLNQLNVREPEAQVERVSITDLSLKQVDLQFDIAVDNPNDLGIELNGFEYDLQLNNASFLKGQKNTKLEIRAKETATIQIPLSLTFDQVRNVFKSFSDLDTIPYQIDLQIGVELPVLGVIQVPISKKGSFPNIRVPAISLSSVELGQIGLSGADLNVKIKINNPNTFAFIADQLNYNLEVSGTNWITGSTPNSIGIKKKAEQTVAIPVSLNFFDMGAGIYKLLSGDSELSYRLSGNADFKSELDVFKSFSLPFDKSGKINLTK